MSVCVCDPFVCVRAGCTCMCHCVRMCVLCACVIRHRPYMHAGGAFARGARLFVCNICAMCVCECMCVYHVCASVWVCECECVCVALCMWSNDHGGGCGCAGPG